MEVLTKGIYYVREDENIRLWHNCNNYKDRDEARVEILLENEDEDVATYKCSYCDFVYNLDKHMNLG